MRVVLAMVLSIGCVLAGAADSTREDFLQVIGRPKAPLAPSAANVTEENGYALERVSFAPEPGERVPVLIVRKGQPRGRQAVVIALHGTGGSKDGMRGMLQASAD